MPQPDGPISETKSPWAMARSMSASAVTGPSPVAKVERHAAHLDHRPWPRRGPLDPTSAASWLMGRTMAQAGRGWSRRGRAHPMAVAVVQVGVVRVAMDQGCVAVRMRMGLAGWVAGAVRVPVVRVVLMGVVVLQGRMRMVVLVPLGQMQPEAEAHEAAGHEQASGQGLAQQEDGERRADERGQGEVGAGAGGAEVAQGQHEQSEAEAVAGETDHAGGG